MNSSKKIDVTAKRTLLCLGCAMLCLTGCSTPDKTLPISAEEKACGYSLSLICDAAAENNLDDLTLLLDAKTDTEERIAGETPLMLAAKNGHADAVKLLLDRGAQINARNPDTPDSKRGMTALMLAAQQGHDEVVRVLLEYGADVTVKTRLGRTALDLAVRAKKEKTVRMLKDFSSGTVKAVTPYGITRSGCNLEKGVVMKKIILAVLFSTFLGQQSYAASAVAYCQETGCYGWAENYVTVQQAITAAKEYCRQAGGRSPEIFLSSSGTGYGAIAYNSGTWKIHASVAYEDLLEACMVSHQNCLGADTDKKIVAVWYDYGGGTPPSQWDQEEREWVKELNDEADILESVLDACL